MFWSKKNSIKNTIRLNPKSRSYAIGDIHGCIETFKSLIEKINLQKSDNLFLIGDYIDRGNDSKAVVYHIMDLIKEGYNIFPLLGNHEDDMLTLDKYKKPNLFKQHFKSNGINNLIDENYIFDVKAIDFFTTLPLYYIVDNYILVHAGIDFTKKHPLANKDIVLWIRETKYDEKIAGKRIIIHGHTPTELSEIVTSIKNNNKVICIDNGCVYAKENIEGLGNLVCFNLINKELIIQKNID